MPKSILKKKNLKIMDYLNPCPLLIANPDRFGHYEGFISIKEHDFKVEIILGEDRSLKKAEINCDTALWQLLLGERKIVEKILHKSETLSNFLVEFKNIINRNLESKSSSLVPPPAQYYNVLLSEIDEMGWDKLLYIDDNFQNIHLQTEDESCREHILQIKLTSLYPEETPACSVDLPHQFDLLWTPKMRNLKGILKQFKKCLTKYQDFWNLMDEIDNNTWTLEPENPSRSSLFRRIAIEPNASIQIHIDCNHPRLLPDCRFLGADHVINPLKKNVHENLEKWDLSETLLKNLENVLCIQFPSPEFTSKEEFSAECGICYAYRLEDTIPEIVCSDLRCGQTFHQICLCEWLRSLPSCRQSFNTMFGECPYCSKGITVKLLV